MKKRVIVLVLVGAAAAVGGFFLMKPNAKTRAPGKEPPPAVSGQTPAQPQEKPAAQPEKQPQAPAPAAEQLPKGASSPIRIRFEASTLLEKDKPVPVTLAVESVPEGWPVQVGEGARLELLLRLPIGVKLQSENWTPVEMSKEEKNDPTGPWSLYEKKIPLKITPGVPPEFLLKETMQLAVVEEGTNWIITTRVRLVQGSDTWQVFGALFATLQGNSGEFHTVPKAPTDIRSAQAN